MEMRLALRTANYTDAEQEYELIRTIPADENGFTNEWHGISREDFEEKCLKVMIDYACGRNLPEGYVPETYLFLWDEDEIVGQFRIRHYLTEALRNGAGHIGYFIKKECRGKGYASQGLHLALKIAAEIVPEDGILLRVNKNNPASLKVMQKNGGSIYREDAEKYYVRIRFNTSH